MPVSVIRTEAFDLFAAQVEQDIANAEGQRAASQADANAAPSPMQSHHDTMRAEADALAGGHQRILKELLELRVTLKKIRDICVMVREEVTAGALVALEDEDEALFRYFVIPEGRGRKITLGNGKEYTCVNPKAPLATGMIGKTVGDEVTVRTQKDPRILEIIEVL